MLSDDELEAAAERTRAEMDHAFVKRANVYAQRQRSHPIPPDASRYLYVLTPEQREAVEAHLRGEPFAAVARRRGVCRPVVSINFRRGAARLRAAAAANQNPRDVAAEGRGRT